MLRRVGEVFLLGDLRVGIHFEDVYPAIFSEPVIYPRVSA
jgi:hypothetical protein